MLSDYLIKSFPKPFWFIIKYKSVSKDDEKMDEE